MTNPSRYRGKTNERGLGKTHQNLRAILLPLAWGMPCPLCGRTMFQNQPLDLDHEIPRALGGGGRSRIAHRWCNRSAGARLGNQLRRTGQLQPRPRQTTTRVW